MRSATSWIPPSREELKRLIQKSGLPVQKFFNTSGKKYRELNLKEKLKTMSEEEMLDLLFRRHADQKAHRHRRGAGHRRFPGGSVRGGLGAGECVTARHGFGAISGQKPSTLVVDGFSAFAALPVFPPLFAQTRRKRRGDDEMAAMMTGTRTKTAARHLVEQLAAWAAGRCTGWPGMRTFICWTPWQGRMRSSMSPAGWRRRRP